MSSSEAAVGISTFLVAKHGATIGDRVGDSASM